MLETVIPSPVKKKIGAGYVQKGAWPAADAVQAILEKTKARNTPRDPRAAAPVEPAIRVTSSASPARRSSVPTIRKLARLGMIAHAGYRLREPRGATGVSGWRRRRRRRSRPPLNEYQQRVFDELRPRVAAGGFRSTC